MKRFISFLYILFSLSVWAEDNTIYLLQPGRDYYIWNKLYDRPLALNSTQTNPRLVPYKEADEQQYLFTAEAAPTPGYVLLRHKATGKYIAASTSNSYAIVTQSSSGTGDAYQWRIKPGTHGFLINKRSSSKSVGVDKGETSGEIGIWYDKGQNLEISSFEVYEATGATFEMSRRNYLCKELSNVVEYMESESQNKKYPVIARNYFTKVTAQVRDWLKMPDKYSTQELMLKDSLMRDSLRFTKQDITVLLTQSDMSSFGSTFSLGMSELTMNDSYANDSAYVLIRSKEGLGARMKITESGNYAFVMKDAAITVYRNGEAVERIEAYYVPMFSAQELDPEWTLIRRSRISGSLPEILSEKESVIQGGGASVDKYGNKTRTVVSLTNTQMSLDEQIDFHILSEEAPLTNCAIDLKNEDAWLIFDNTRPSTVVSTYLKQITINGVAARVNENCRVVIYLNGALVMPYNQRNNVFFGFDGEQYTGNSLNYGVGTFKDLNKNANRLRSFRLKRGYMATLASGTDGSGYSRVYVADHHDLEVPVLPDPLYGRITSIVVKKWQYVSKKGWCSTNSSDAIATEAGKVRATWYYTWSADRNSTYDTEYIPIRQHKWWPSIADIAKHQDATACLSLNEPEHSEQHNNCDCGGAIDAWTACTITPDFQSTGMRIGSPAPTADSWLTDYIKHCNDMSYRCDFVAIHSYWGSNECNDGNAWYNRLKAIYDATKRPIWITEWAYGASWTKESWPEGWSDKLEQNRWRILDIMKKLEEAPFVERYAYYQWDTQFRNLVDWGDGHVTPAGKVYRDMKSEFAYNASVQFVPVCWTPSLKTPSLVLQINDVDQTVDIEVTNPNLDWTEQLILQRLNEDTNAWEDYYTETERYRFDQEKLSYTFPVSDFNLGADQLRVYVKRMVNDDIYSKPTHVGAQDFTSYIKNPSCDNNNTTPWAVTNVETSLGESADGNSSNHYFNLWKSSAFTASMSQTVPGLPAGRYSLSALMRGSANEHLKLTLDVPEAVAGSEQTTSAQASIYGKGNTTDSSTGYLNGWNRVETDYVDLEEGQSLRIRFEAVGTGGSCWYSVDDFTLTQEYIPAPPPTGLKSVMNDKESTPSYNLSGRRATKTEHGVVVHKGKLSLQ